MLPELADQLAALTIARPDSIRDACPPHNIACLSVTEQLHGLVEVAVGFLRLLGERFGREVMPRFA